MMVKHGNLSPATYRRYKEKLNDAQNSRNSFQNHDIRYQNVTRYGSPLKRSCANRRRPFSSNLKEVAIEEPLAQIICLSILVPVPTSSSARLEHGFKL
jgi:hypothetical protein